MAQAGPIRNIVIPVVCLGATALGLRNVYADSTDVEREAEIAACGKPACAAQQIGGSRTPLSHTYTYQLSRESSRTATVECSREFVLIGDYGCELK